MYETKTRSFLKAILWRVISVVIGVVISMLMLDDFSVVWRMHLYFVIVGTSVQYVYERLWNKVEYGRFCEEDTENNIAGSD